MLIQENLSIEEKLRILTDGAKYDVACTSSGVGRAGKDGSLGNSRIDGLCHSFAPDGRCISLLKILYTNQCIHDCRYCINRRSNDTVRTAFTPEEVCRLTMEFYRRNYIEGLFLSSGILDTPDYTMEQLYRTLYLLRREYHFNGYIHVKAIPGADPVLIERVGFLADRMSVNLELPTAEGLKKLAPGKTRGKILRPMRQIQIGIAKQMEREGLLEQKGAVLPDAVKQALGTAGMSGTGAGKAGISKPDTASGSDLASASSGAARPRVIQGKSIYGNYGVGRVSNRKEYFVPAGQSTQMIVGATPESDYHMITVAEALYQNFGLKRVFYSAFVRVNDDSLLPDLPGGPPLLREHRLYQADWLLRFYGFEAKELLSESRPNFNILLDPKCDWAVRHLEEFPVEVMTADYRTLLRVPGLGVRSAKRITAARRTGCLDFSDLKKFGVVLKRAMYFLTCGGKMMTPVRMEENFITSQLVGEEHRKAWDIEHGSSYRQLSLFDDMKLTAVPSGEDGKKALYGEM